MSSTKVLIIEARFYTHLADMALAGAKAALDEAGASYDIASVPGALEIPSVLLFAKDKYDAFVVLGTIIRGQTSHYDMVCGETFRGVYNIARHYGLAVGNGIQTVENEAQAIDRLDPARKNKGGGAAQAAMTLIGFKRLFHGQ